MFYVHVHWCKDPEEGHHDSVTLVTSEFVTEVPFGRIPTFAPTLLDGILQRFNLP